MNNRYLNNTCCIASGKLGTLLAHKRSHWDFSARSGNALSPFGRQSLWFICENNLKLEVLDLSGSDVTPKDAGGLCTLIATCPLLKVRHCNRCTSCSRCNRCNRCNRR